jgi:hypothetical protein
MQITRVFAIVIACSALAQAAVKIPVSVDAGETPRSNSPVTATLTVGKDISEADADAFAKASFAELTPGKIMVQILATSSPQGKQLELRWIEPQLTAHEIKRYELTEPEHAEPSAAFHFVNGDGFRDLLFGEQPVYRYMMKKFDPANRDETVKPFHHVYGMHGEGFITKGPGGMETHHRGLFFGYSTQYGNFWACKDVDQRHVENLGDREFTGPVAARSASVIDWVAKDGKPVVRDTREVTAWHVAPDETILDWVITVQSLSGDIQLGGDPHHGGFHFRAAEEVADAGTTKPSLHKGAATYIRPAGAKQIKDDNWSDTPWVACSFSVKQNPYVVLHMDDPKNPKPMTYSTRPYGRFGAFFKGVIKEHEPVTLRYRIVLLDGTTHANPTVEALAPMYSDFVAPPTVKVEGK